MSRTMAENWRSRSLVLYLLIARLAPCTYGMSNKGHVDRYESPLYITAQPQKRDATICPADYSLCPASLSGGCCPTDRSCGISSCYPTTAPPPTECSMSGYIVCGIDQGGGCCPRGYSCASNGCVPPAGSSYSQDCGANSYLCPSSVGYGCCRNNLACGVGYCYATSFSSVSLTLTITTTISNSIIETITTVIQTAYTETESRTGAAAAASPTVAKFTPSATAIAKLAASEPPSNGLTQAQLGGIIGAAVVVVIAVCLATVLILRRLNAVAREAKAAALKNSRSSSSRPRPHGPTPSGGSGGYAGIENVSFDPLLITSDSSTNPSHSTVGLPRPSAVYSTRNDFEPGVSPPIPAPYGSLHGWSGGYQQVPMSEPHHSDASGHRRRQSDDSPGRSLSPTGAVVGGYFDIDPALRDQNLRYGQSPTRPSVQAHGRQWSDASDVSQQSQQSQQSGSSGVAELDAGPDGDRRSSLQRAMQGVGFTRLGGARRSGEKRRRSSSGGVTIRWDVGAAAGMNQRLENVQEYEYDSKGPTGLSGPSGTGKGTSQIRTRERSHGSTGTAMGITGISLSAVELDRLEQQKVMGNLADLRQDPK